MGRKSKGINIERPITTHVPPATYKWLNDNKGQATMSAFARAILIGFVDAKPKQ